jgi:hypothetical protein
MLRLLPNQLSHNTEAVSDLIAKVAVNLASYIYYIS